METNKEKDTRRRIEDMTISEIREAKSRLEDRIGEAIEREVEAFSQTYDWGHIGVSVETEIHSTGLGYIVDKRKYPCRVERNVCVSSDLVNID